MAPRFKQNMYQTYTKDIGADAIICFPFLNDKFIFPFRDKLTEKISKETNLYLLENEGEPTEVDSWFLFFNSEDINFILSILLDSGTISLEQKSIKNL